MAEVAASHPLLPAFVPARSIACSIIRRQDTEYDRNSFLHIDGCNSLCHFAAHKIEMGC